MNQEGNEYARIEHYSIHGHSLYLNYLEIWWDCIDLLEIVNANNKCS